MCSVYYVHVPNTPKDIPDNWVKLFKEFDIDNTDLLISQKQFLNIFKNI